MQPLIITAACGQAYSPGSRTVPDTIRDVVDAVARAAHAGAAIAQIRAPSKPHPLTGRPQTDINHWVELVSRIRDACDIVIHTGTAAMEIDARLEMMEKVRPELASFLLGHHGIVVRGHEHASLRTRADSLRLLKGHLKAGVKPDFEVFHSGHVRNLVYLMEQEKFSQPVLVTLFFGWEGGEWSPPTVEELLHRIELLPNNAIWTITTTGTEQTIMQACAIARGGHVRAGLGDYPFYNDGVYGHDTAEFVARQVRLADELNREVATPARAAEMLGIRRS